MVRGDPRCPCFCSNCKADCRCQKADCQSCHNCRDKEVFGIDRNLRGTIYTCNFYHHDCKWYLKEEEEKLEKGSKEKADEKLSLKVLDFPKIFSSEVIKITVGGSPELQHRFVPKNVLINNAECFKHLFSFEEQAGTQAAVVLNTEVDRPDAFDCFIQFAYWKDYYIRRGNNTKLEIMALHGHVYVLAERLQAPSLKDAAVRKASEIAVALDTFDDASSNLHNYKEHLPCMISDVYSNTPPPPDPTTGNQGEDKPSHPVIDRFRHLLAAFCARRLSLLKKAERFNECLKVFPDFAVDQVAQLPDAGHLEVGEDGYLKMN